MRWTWSFLALICLGESLAGCSSKTNDRFINPEPPKEPQLTRPRIAFVSNRSGTDAVYLFDPATESTLRLTPGNAIDSSPAIAPDGKRIAVSTRVGASFHILTMAVDGSDRDTITSSTISSDYFPRWSPDGKSIAFTRYNPADSLIGVYIVTASGGTAVAVTDDGASILFDWCKTGILLAQNGGGLYTIRTDGTGRLGVTPYVVGWAQYSPDATQIAVSTVGANPQILLFDVENSQFAQVTAGVYDACAHPTWSPDGTQIVFQGTNENLPFQIMRINTDGRNPTQLFITGSNESLPDWGPRNLK